MACPTMTSPAALSSVGRLPADEDDSSFGPAENSANSIMFHDSPRERLAALKSPTCAREESHGKPNL